MPYIPPPHRDNLDRQPLGRVIPQTSGELNYALTRLCLNYIAIHGEHYAHWNDVLGALEGCKQELYRRHIAPYEDLKIQQNGDLP